LPIPFRRTEWCDEFNRNTNQEDVWQTNISTKINRAFEIMSKRRKGFPSETRVKKGVRVVHGDKELREKLGRNDPCPCGSGRRF
jgi:transposase-like protein